MPTPCFVVAMFFVGTMVLGAGEVSGQNYPNKPIRIIAASPGAGSDIPARLVAQAISGSLGQQVIVENRPGMYSEIASQAPPDGYTLLVAGSPHWILPLLRKTLYDPVTDFSPISLLDFSVSVVVVHPSLPVKSVKELIALAKAKPGMLNYGSSGQGSSPHLATEIFKSMAGVNIVHIPYKGAGPAVIGLTGGQIQLMFAAAPSVMPNIKADRLRALAVSSAQPSALAPGLPTVAASGLPGYESVSMIGMFAPAKTPEPIIKRLNQEIVRVLNLPDVKEKFFNGGMEIVGSTPEELAAKIEFEVVRIGKVIKEGGIKAE